MVMGFTWILMILIQEFRTLVIKIMHGSLNLLGVLFVLSGARKNQRALGQQLALLHGLSILYGPGSELPQTPRHESMLLQFFSVISIIILSVKVVPGNLN